MMRFPGAEPCRSKFRNMETKTIELEVDGAVGQIALNRPDRLNAITPLMLEELIGAARWFDEKPDVRVVVVSGNGRAFCSGYDLDAFSDQPAGFLEKRMLAGLGGRAAEAIERMRAVTVSKLHGWVVGGGVVFAAATDIRVAAADARFKIPEVELGISLNWAGIPRLVREIGPAMTRELVMTCREFSPDEAKNAGFLNRVVDREHLDEEVDSLVSDLTAKPSVPLLATKDQVNAITTALSARIGHYMDADAFVAVTSSEEFEKALDDYRSQLSPPREEAD